MTSDGAGVMTSEHTGVGAWFTEIDEHSNLLTVQCICHSLALASDDTDDRFVFVKSSKETMTSI